jgi:hypothetical protein
MKVTRAISLTNFVVASSALCFQVFVLYPWHKELDAGFEDLKKEHLKLLRAVQGRLGEQKQISPAAEERLEPRATRRWWLI